MYDDLFKLFWSKDAYAFDRDVHDQYPYKVHQEKDKTVLIHNVVGIAEEDLSVKIESNDGRDFLVISGETKDELFGDYSIKSSFRIKTENFDKIQYEVKNGILRVALFKKQPEKAQIKIERV